MPGMFNLRRPNHTREQTPATATAKTSKIKTKAVVPFEMLPTNHMLVQVQINDKGPYCLIFDLGAPIHVVEQPSK